MKEWKILLLGGLVFLLSGCSRTIDGICITLETCHFGGMTERVCGQVYPEHVRYKALPLTSVFSSHTERSNASQKMCEDEGFGQCNNSACVKR